MGLDAQSSLPNVFGHVLMGQAHRELLFVTLNSYVVQKLSAIWGQNIDNFGKTSKRKGALSKLII